MKLKYQLPRVYESLLPKDILLMEPAETKATCDNCNMAKPRNKREVFYENHLKCCTFHPFLPNYVVGAIFTEPTLAAPSAISSLQQKIQNQEYSLPLGIVAPANYQVPFNARKEHDFGRREDWLCPYFNREQQNCGIWRHRGAVCTTFYCQSSFGAKGLKFWEELSSYITYVEMALMEEALVMLDFSPRQISDLLEYLNIESASKSQLKSSRLPEKKGRDLWNGYYDDQVGFFKKCFQVVNDLDRKSFQELLSEPGERLQDRLRMSFNKISREKI
jgi:Fe-S-cluster containining protein